MLAFLLYAFLIKLASNQCHVNSPSNCAKAALALRKEALFHVFPKTVEHDAGEDVSAMDIRRI